MNTRFLILSFLLLISKISLSQDLPNITPPSPTAFELTKYGDIHINESKGKLSHSVPLHTFTSGSLQLPISLSYTGSGVKVDQLSSWTGINWVLNAGGVITRIVKDRPDELGNRFLYTFSELETMTENNNGIADINLLESSNVYDTQVDHFSFSFGSYSGSFYLDKTLQPKLANYDTELRIEFLGGVQNTSNQVIIITDPNGIKYYFGGINGTEQTRLNFTNNSSGLLPTTAYYLYKIANLVGDEINLIYGSEANPYNIKLSKSQSATGTLDILNVTYTSFNETVYNKIYGGKYLSKITSNRSNFEAHFNSTPISSDHFNRVLNDIEIVKVTTSGLEDFKKFELTYISKNILSSSTRFFLQKIDFLNSQGIKEYDHHFDYNSIASLPDRLSSAKDYYGYYNGKGGGSDLPINNHSFLNSVPGFVLSDREPDFSKAVLGALTKIHYPSGGNTSIEYEGSQIKEDIYNTGYLGVYNDLSQMYPNEYPNPDTQLIKTFFVDDESSNMPLPFEDQQVVVNINATAQGSVNHHYKVHVKVENIFNSQQLVQNQSFNFQYFTYSYTKAFTFDFLENNAYKITVELELASTSNPASVDVNVNFKYISGIDVVDGIGLRVKKTIDNPIEGVPLTKRFYYQKIEDIGDITKVPYGTDLSGGFISSYNSYSIYTVNPVPGDHELDYLADKPVQVATLQSDPIFSNYFSNGPFYKNVTISYGGDDFENGGVQKIFRYIGESTGVNFLSGIGEGDLSDLNITNTQKQNRDVFDGRLLSESIFKLDNGSLFMTKRTENIYATDISESETNMAIKRLYQRAQTNGLAILDGLHIGLFNTHVNKFNMTSQTTKDFIALVPVSDLANADNYEYISTQKQFEYNTYVGLPSEVQTNTSNGKNIITKTFYPDDVINTGFLGLDALSPVEKAAIDKLKKGGQHRVAEPIQTETHVDIDNDGVVDANESFSVQRTNYSEPYVNIVLPKDVQTLKGTYNPSSNLLKNRIEFKHYYANGNVQEVSKSDGTSIYYIWGYGNQYPIAKIENFIKTQATAILNLTNTAITASNADTSIATENALRTALNNIRNNSALSAAMVTTYTYDPLIGVTSVTDPKGYTVFYEYDDFNRLKYVRDKDSNILSKNEYNYKQ